LVKVGSSGELYQEYAITSSGLERIDKSITLSTPFTVGPPTMASAHGVLFALDLGLPQVDRFISDPVNGSFSLGGSNTALQTGVGAFSIDPSGSYLYVDEAHDDFPGNYEANLNAFHIDAEGKLTQAPGAPFIYFGGPASGFDCCAGLGSPLVFTPDGTKAYAVVVQGCPCHGSIPSFWTVQPFLRDPQTGAIAKSTLQEAPPTSEYFIGGVAVARNGKYAVFATIDGLNVYSIDPSTGSLTQVAMPSPVPPADRDHLYLEITATRDGKFVYLDQAGSGLIFGFHVEADGSLTPVPGSPYNLGPVEHILLTSSDEYLFVTGVTGGLFAFQRDHHTGALVLLGSAPVDPVFAIVNLN